MGARSCSALAICLSLFTMACSENAASSGGGAGGASSSSAGGAGTAADAGVTLEVPACALPARYRGSIDVPSPLISAGKPVYGSRAVPGESTEARFVEAAVDGAYRSGAPCQLGVPTEQAPAWVAIEVGAGPESVLLSWSDASFGPFNEVSQGSPSDYRIEVSADSTDGSDGTWETALEVTDNPVRSRAHRLEFAGKSWVKLVVTAAGKGTTNVRFDEIAVHDVTDASAARPVDSWLFMGDSITQGAFTRSFGDANFDAVLHAAQDEYDPLVIAAGIGGEKASDGLAHVSEWLELLPDIHHVAIAYGTNDAWGNNKPTTVRFEANLVGIIEAVLADGRVPILARIPYATAAHKTVPEFNAIIQELTLRYELPCGPDLYSIFQQHPDELNMDGVHLIQAGIERYNRAWAEAVRPLYAD